MSEGAGIRDATYGSVLHIVALDYATEARKETRDIIAPRGVIVISLYHPLATERGGGDRTIVVECETRLYQWERKCVEGWKVR